jgi:26S proteasome regulatory subunit T4
MSCTSALARQLTAGQLTTLQVVSSAIVDKYIGESARLIREMFGYAKEHQPCIIFMDEIDAIGGRRFSEGTSADREIQRTLMELLSQLDGFDAIGKVKMIMATNRCGPLHCPSAAISCVQNAFVAPSTAKPAIVLSWQANC